MTLEFSIDPNPGSFGNHFIVGLLGTELNDADKKILSTVRPAGILLLKRNFDHTLPYPEWSNKLSLLLDSVREYTERSDLMITVDHEGERVNRTPPPMTVFPNAAFWGAHAAEVARAHATELRSLGINVSWAPLADIHSNPDNPVIGQRAYGRTPEEVVAAAVPYLTTLQQEGILGCAKHFPGHGDTKDDSHHSLPILDLSIEALRRRELIPFKALIEAGAPLIMTAHILFPAIDPNTPATMSQFFVTQVLRQELGYQHILITDDLDMKAVSKQFESSSMIAHALNVGCDMFIVARQPGADDQRVIVMAQQIADAMQNQTVPEQRLFESFCRINTVFQDLLPDNEPHLLDAAVFARHAQLAQRIRAEAS